MKLNQAGIDLIKQFEGCKLTTYKDATGINTIGYGHTGPEAYTGAAISPVRAAILLEADLTRIANSVENMLIDELNDNQFSALVAFAFNVGQGNLKKSTLLRLVNTEDMGNAAKEFIKWNKAGGKVLEGLTRRREAERDLFMA